MKCADFNGVGLIPVKCMVIKLLIKTFIIGLNSMSYFFLSKAIRLILVTHIVIASILLFVYQLRSLQTYLFNYGDQFKYENFYFKPSM